MATLEAINFNNLYDFQAYCNYEDLEGIYCDACKKWLIYDKKSNDKPFYIVNDELEACPDCVKVRNGHYPYLSDFSMFKDGFKKSKQKTLKREILKLFRTNGSERFIKKHIFSCEHTGDAIELSSETYRQLLIMENKYKYIPYSILEHDFKNINVAKTVMISSYSDINHNLIKILQQITKIQHERPVMKFIVTKHFGTLDQKQKLYNHYKKADELLNNVSFETFWNDFGLHYIMSLEDLIFNNELLDLIEMQNISMLLQLYDYDLHWSEKAQHYFERCFCKPKQFNIHKLGYY